MNKLYVLAKLGDLLCLVLKSDLKYLNTDKVFNVFCVVVNLKTLEVQPPLELERHFKFNPWDTNISEEERLVLFNQLKEVFSNKILTNIEITLSEHA